MSKICKEQKKYNNFEFLVSTFPAPTSQTLSQLPRNSATPPIVQSTLPVQSTSGPRRSSQEEQPSEVKPAEAVKLLYERCMALLDPSQQSFCQVKFKVSTMNKIVFSCTGCVRDLVKLFWENLVVVVWLRWFGFKLEAIFATASKNDTCFKSDSKNIIISLC